MGSVKSSNAIFLSVSEGKIVRRFTQPTPDSKQRTTKEGKIVNEETYKGWSGRIADIQFKEHEEYGSFVNVHISDGEENAVIQIKQSSGYANAFLKMLPNVDLGQDVVITPNMKVEGDKKKTSMFITQGGNPVKWAYTRENPNGLPELKQIKIKGKLTYDDSDVIEFLQTMVNTTILPKLKKADPVAVEGEETDEAPF